ncbi:hypothetical protein [Aquimarina sp. AU58]|uniref:hypothetical protein n=1 Tax=Aquimarina sp. AU58 TaxID=1874112 RepID=UPI000D6E5EB5|nr:hypothetical protein [Aquimarina sp. AU58]
MEEIGKALKSIFDKLSDFFDIFDLSFFVSGFFTTIILLFWSLKRGIDLPIEVLNTHSIIAFILCCYINGLLCFALGRWIRMGIIGNIRDYLLKKKGNPKKFDSRFETILKAHEIDQEPNYKKYLEKPEYRGVWRLYVRLWADIRNDEKYTSSRSFLGRYWVMSATYDGLSISIFIALILFIESKFGLLIEKSIDISCSLFFVISGLLLVLFMVCLREAKRFERYQVEELVATIASKK